MQGIALVSKRAAGREVLSEDTISDEDELRPREIMATSPFKFLQEVRSETQKVTWPTRRETMITTAMVFVMVAVASIFFLVADQVIRLLVTFVLGIGG